MGGRLESVRHSVTFHSTQKVPVFCDAFFLVCLFVYSLASQNWKQNGLCFFFFFAKYVTKH